MKDSLMVLFLDDEPESCFFFKKTFDKYFNIVTLSNPLEIKEIIDKQHQDIAVVVSDHFMPDIKGTNLLTSLRKDYPHIVRILTTAYADLASSVEAINSAQIYAYITKPWDKDFIIKTLFNAIAEYKSQQTFSFLSLGNSIAHEIRNPIGQIQHHLQAIEKSATLCIDQTDDSIIRKQQNEIIQSAKKSNTALNRGMQVIDMILEDIRRNNIHQEDFTFLSAKTLINQALAEYAYNEEREKSVIVTEIEKDFIFKGNAYLFHFIVFNLLRNVLYYLPSHPELKITIQSFTGKTNNCIVFTDTGPGITKEQIHYIFHPFFSCGKSHSTGLGLAFCKKVMESFNGDILCESLPGQYTKFVLYFPQCNQQDIKTTTVSENSHSYDKSLPPPNHLKVLLVEDDSQQRHIMQEMFAQHKMSLLEAEHGEQALAILNKTPCDLIIMDINMPVMDGWEATEKIRQSNAYYKNIPIIGLSSYGGHDQLNRAKKMGMNDYLQKPANWEILNHKMHQCLSKDKSNLSDPIVSTYTYNTNPTTHRKEVRENQTIPTNTGSQKLETKTPETNKLDFDIPIKHYQYKIETIKSFLKSFVEDNTNLATELKTAYQEGNYKNVAFKLHKLLPLVRMFHFKETAELIQNLEDQVTEGSINPEAFDQAITLLINKKLNIFFEAAKEQNL